MTSIQINPENLPKVSVNFDRLESWGLSSLLNSRKNQLKEYQNERAKILAEKFVFDQGRTFNGNHPLRDVISRDIKEKKQRDEFEQNRKEMLDYIDPLIEKIQNEITHLEVLLEQEKALMPDAIAEINASFEEYNKSVKALYAEFEKMVKVIKSHQTTFKNCGITLADYETQMQKKILDLPRPYLTPFNTFQFTNWVADTTPKAKN